MALIFKHFSVLPYSFLCLPLLNMERLFAELALVKIVGLINIVFIVFKFSVWDSYVEVKFCFQNMKGAFCFSPQTYHLLILLQQRAGKIKLRICINWSQSESRRGSANKLHKSRFNSWEGVGNGGLISNC